MKKGKSMGNPIQILRTVCVVSCSFFALALPVTAEQYTIADVSIKGNVRVDALAIRAQLHHTSGTITTNDISEDIKALYRTGFFDEVNASVESRNSGHSILAYKLVERPLVRKVFIRGNTNIKEHELADILKFDARRFLDKTKLRTLARDGASYYQTQGYYDAAIDYTVVPVANDQVDVTFNVTEGSRYKIKKVVFRGLSLIDASELRSVIQTKRYKWWNSWILGTGRLNQEILNNDRTLVRQYFLDHGLIDGSISDGHIEKQADHTIVIAFEVNEGPQYTFGKVSAGGDLIEQSVDKTLEGTAVTSGRLFNASQLRDDSFKISDKFGDQGFAFANVVPNTAINRDARTVDVEYQIERGKLVTVDRINIKGNEKTYDNVIRREMKLAEQDTFSSSKLRRSQQLLQRLGYFEEVNISTDPGKADDKVDLNVNVREGSTGTFSAGAGFSTSDGALFNARVSEENIFGTGRRASVSVDYGTERDNIQLSLEDRRVNDTNLSLGSDIQRTNREFSDFDRRLTGGSLVAGYPLEKVFGDQFEDWGASIKYEYLDINIRNVDRENAADLVLASEGRSTSSGFTPKLTRNTINNPLNPTDGSKQILSVELTGLGGSEEYYLFEGRHVSYTPLMRGEWGDLVFSFRSSFGYGDTFNGETFPLFRRYFPGGINSVRGFKNRTLGPKDSRGNEYGGSKEFVNNFELIFPLVNSAGIKGLVFYDAGQAFDDDKSISLPDLRQAYGFGFRWSSPLGPIRLEFGIPIDREEGENGVQTQFSFGAPL